VGVLSLLLKEDIKELSKEDKWRTNANKHSIDPDKSDVFNKNMKFRIIGRISIRFLLIFMTAITLMDLERTL
jgi:hypothetical protein